MTAIAESTKRAIITKPKTMSTYRVWCQMSEWDEPWCERTYVALTAAKARYQHWQYIQDGIWEEPYSGVFRFLHSQKIGGFKVSDLFGNRENFNRMKESRGISFAYIGMKIEVNGKIGTITGSNYSRNLDVCFDGECWTDNCHPGWMTKYIGKDGSVILDNTIKDQSCCVDCGAFQSCKLMYAVTEESIGCEFSPTLFKLKLSVVTSGRESYE